MSERASDGREQAGYHTSKEGKRYHKSATANASVAPTNENTVKNATRQGNLTEEELDFVTIVHYEYGLLGQLPDKDYLKSNYGYKGEEVLNFYNEPLIKQALSERGVETSAKQLGPVGLPELLPIVVKPSPKLTPLQLLVANCLLDLTDTRSEKKKLSDHGVSTAKYQSWLRDPDFSGYLRERAEALVGDVQHEAMLSLVDSVRSGKLDAIKYYHELTGRFVSQSNGGGNSSMDMQAIMVRVVEIIVSEVDDPAIAARIGEKLKALVLGGQVAGLIQTPAVVQPEIAPPRVLSEKGAKMLSSGVGINV